MAKEHKVIQQIAEDTINKQNMIAYLNVVKNNPTLSMLNQCMVFLQNKDAKIVCGRKAWNEVGREIKTDSNPIVLFFPSVTIKEMPEEFKIDGIPQAVGNTDVGIYLKDAKYLSEYIPVNGYGIDDTEGDEIDITPKLISTFMDEIIEITQATPEFVKEEVLEGEKGKYDKETNTFYFSNGMDLSTEYGKQEYDKTALSLYIDYVLENYNIQDITVKYAITYVLFERYHFTHNIEAPLFRKLDKRNIKEKIAFMSAIQFLVNGIIQDFEGYSLNFDETALVNDLLFSSDYAEMWIAFDKASVSIEDEDLQDTMTILKNKLMRTAEGFLEDLVALRYDKRLYTFPLQPLIIDNIDYMRKERLKLLMNVEL